MHKTRGDEAQALADGSELWAGAEELQVLEGAGGPSRCSGVCVASVPVLAVQRLSTISAFLRKRESSLQNFLVSKTGTDVGLSSSEVWWRELPKVGDTCNAEWV